MSVKTFTAPVRLQGGRTQALKALDKDVNELGDIIISSLEDKEYPGMGDQPHIIARTVIYEKKPIETFSDD